MTAEQRTDIKALIRFYERRGWDWGLAVGFLACRYNGITLGPPRRRSRRTSDQPRMVGE